MNHLVKGINPHFVSANLMVENNSEQCILVCANDKDVWLLLVTHKVLLLGVKTMQT